MQNTLPKHVAIIPDGNRRWAAERQLQAIEGHEQGAKMFRDISAHAADQGIEHLSVWGMSLDNFTKRSAKEVAGLLRLFRQEFLHLAESDDVHSRQVKVNVIGHWQEKFPKSVRQAIERALGATEGYSKHVLNFFLAYNGTDEMVQAVQKIVKSGHEKVTEKTIKEHLFTKDLPPVDLLIRTGGEPHLSAGFMMWDIADAELYFTKTFWPAFTTQEFDTALADFATRRRKKGK